jgi:hypothetical protein
MGSQGLISSSGPAASPFRNGPFTWDQHVTFLAGVSGVNSGGSVFYVDGTNGVAGNNGSSWSTPMLTIQAAVTAASAGDTIFLKGTFTEEVTCTKDSIKFLGAGPNNAENVWMENAAGDTLLTLSGKNCIISNIRFRVPTTGGIAIALTGADYTIIEGCYFQGRTGSLQAILNNGGSSCKILNNIFAYLNTAVTGAAILGVTYTAIPSGWEIAYNTFHSNLRHLSMTMRQSFIHDNLFQAIGLDNDNTDLTATTKCDVYTGSAGDGQYNTVTRNMFQGDYSNTGGYKASANDNWFGNISDDVAESTVGDWGITTAVPGA